MPTRRSLRAVIFDVDGVLLASPHERAWRQALDGFADPARFTTAFYQAHVAGKPRMDGARAALEGLGVPNAASRAAEYAARKQAILEGLIAAGDFPAFPDALRFAQAVHTRGMKIAAASSSKNAAAMMRLTRLDDGHSLARLLDADLSGHDVPHGKPAPDLFLAASAALGLAPAACVVTEDSPAGIQAGRAGGMATIGIARFHDSSLLEAVDADLVVTSLDQVDIDALVGGILRTRRNGPR